MISIASFVSTVVVLRICEGQPVTTLHFPEFVNPNGLLWRTDYYKLPGLPHWSDVVYLGMAEIQPDLERFADLRWVYRHQVLNTETTGTVGYLLEKRMPQERPGRLAPVLPKKQKLDCDMSMFQAPLAPPNVRGVVRLLIQHQDVFGKKMIKSITVRQGARRVLSRGLSS